MKKRFALKAATDEMHRELDDRLSRLDLRERDDYCRFLLFHARTVPPLEEAMAAAGADQLIDGWAAARRSAAIEQDLSALGHVMPAPVDVPPIDGRAGLLGTAYVVEGSRLGGRVLRKRIGAGTPDAFLRAASEKSWPQLVAALDLHLYSESLTDEAERAARRCFTLYLDVAREAEF